MQTSFISSHDHNSILTNESEHFSFLSCHLQWRMGKLLVKNSQTFSQPYLASLENKQSLIECLKHSPISLVSIDPKIGATVIKIWADACEEANKPIFVNIPSYQKLPQTGNRIFTKLTRIIDWTLALFLVFLMSPFLLPGLILMRISSPNFLFDYHWYIGEKRQLVRNITFRNNPSVEMSDLHIIRITQYCLEKYFILVNVLQYRMRLIGYQHLPLEDAILLILEKQRKQLNKEHHILEI
ncbi:MAG: heterocyst development glycosyltransferase HepC [Cuspidothrix sp.]